MANGNGNGWANTIRITVQMLGHTGLIVVCIILLIYVASGGKLPGQMTEPSSVELKQQNLENEAKIIDNQGRIISLLDKQQDALNEAQKIAYRQSIILENVARTLDRIEARR